MQWTMNIWWDMLTLIMLNQMSIVESLARDMSTFVLVAQLFGDRLFNRLWHSPPVKLNM